MNRFFISPKQIHESKVIFPADIAHQIRRVLRLQHDDLVEVLDNSGHVYRVRLDFESDEIDLTGNVLESYIGQTEPEVRISLNFGLTNREKVEWVLQKGTEVGVSVFQPFISERTLVQTADLPIRKVERWERIIREAAEQSHRSRLPELKTPMPFSDCIQNGCQENELNLLAWEDADAESQNLNDTLGLYKEGNVGLFIGPEGGFSREEADLARSFGCIIVSLGSRILRMETAGILFPALVLSGLNAL